MSDEGGLYMLVSPCGGRYWRYNYRIEGRQKTLALGIYPYVSLALARARHERARGLLAAGQDPSLYRRVIRRPTTLVARTEMSTESQPERQRFV